MLLSIPKKWPVVVGKKASLGVVQELLQLKVGDRVSRFFIDERHKVFRDLERRHHWANLIPKSTPIESFLMADLPHFLAVTAGIPLSNPIKTSSSQA